MAYINFKYNCELLPASLYRNNIYLVPRKDNFYRLGISLSRRCNLACRHCYYRDEIIGHNSIDMSISKLRAILYQMPKLASINFGQEGEPFAYPHIFDALSLAAEKTEAIMLVSNGTLFTDTYVKELKHYPLVNIVLSTEGATQKSYETCRVGSSFLSFCKNVANLANEFGDIVSLHATIFKENLQSLLELPALASSLGVRNISFQQLRMKPAIMKRGITPAGNSELLIFLRRLIEIADNKNVFLNFDSYFSSPDIMNFLRNNPMDIIRINMALNNTQACHVIYQCTSILADGSIFPCCGDFRPAIVNEYSFDGIFNHQYLLKLRFLTQNNHTPYQCKVCRHETKSNRNSSNLI